MGNQSSRVQISKFNHYGLGAIPVENGKVLWKKLFPMWITCTLRSPYFEVFRTRSMGLGLRSLVSTSLTNMSSEIPVFLDFISEEEEVRTNVFRVLTEEKHPSPVHPRSAL